MGKLFKKLKEGLEESIAHKQGKISLKTEDFIIPEPPMSCNAQEIKKALPTSKIRKN